MEIDLAPIVSDYYLDDSFVSLIIGPIGSGKTLGSILKIDRLMHEQEPDDDGIIRTRTAIIRNTSVELKDTTIKSFEGYYGDLLKFNWGNLTALYEHGNIRAEFLFRALDKPGDMRKLLSLEITYAYLNEVRELPKEALENITSRLGRYPYPSDGPGATKQQCICDTNAFDNETWIYKLFIENRPKGWSMFIQPPALLEDNSVNPKAENLKNLPYEYYRAQTLGKTKDYIDVMYKVKFIPLQTGKPVYPEYNDQLHCIRHELLSPPSKNLPLICGGDNGRWSAFLIGQLDPLGRLVVFDELVTDDVNLTTFSKIIESHMQLHYSGYKFESWLDPWAANTRGQVTDDTMFKVYNNAHLMPRTSMTGSPQTMVEAAKTKFGQILMKQPSIIISDKCTTLRKGLNGGYQYKRINVSGDKYADKPDKGKYSHACNAFEFLVDGTGASRELKSSNKMKEYLKNNGGQSLGKSNEWSPYD
jgi:hypothetical protein